MKTIRVLLYQWRVVYGSKNSLGPQLDYILGQNVNEDLCNGSNFEIGKTLGSHKVGDEKSLANRDPMSFTRFLLTLASGRQYLSIQLCSTIQYSVIQYI